MTIFLTILFWIFIWWLIGIIPLICCYLFDKELEEATLKDIVEATRYACFGPFIFVALACIWVADNGDRVILKKKKK
jgi:hypothetical protein